MERVRIDQRLRINVRGFDPEATTYEVGEHEVAASVAAYVRAHPEFGSVLDEESPSATAGASDDPKPSEAPKETDLSRLNKAKLLELAAERGLEVEEAATKAQIIALLTEQEARLKEFIAAGEPAAE